MVYTLTAAPCIDYRLDLGGKPIRIGGVNRPVGFAKWLGGKGITVGGMLNNLGVKNIPIVAVGGEVGEQIKRMVQTEYSDTVFVETETESRINVVVLGDMDTRFDPAAPKITPAGLEHIFAYLKASLKPGDVLVLSGSLGQESPDLYARVMHDVANPAGAVTIIDTVDTALLDALPEHPLFIKPNDEELGDLIGREMTNDAEIIAGGLELLEKGPKNVIVSMGGRGSFFFAHDRKVYFISAARGYKFINPVGTGDSSIAGFIKGFTEHQPIETTLKWMAAAGGATAFSNGLGKLPLFEELSQKIEVTRVR